METKEVIQILKDMYVTSKAIGKIYRTNELNKDTEALSQAIEVLERQEENEGYYTK